MTLTRSNDRVVADGDGAPVSEPELLFSDVEQALRDAVREFLGARADTATTIAMYDGQQRSGSGLWSGLAREMGLAGLLVPAELGGAGASEREVGVVLEELGRFVVPVPFLTSAVLATVLLRDAGTAPDLLSALAAGDRVAAVVVPFSASCATFAPTVSAGCGQTITGRALAVAGAVEADVLLVPIAVADGVEVHAVDAAAASVIPAISLDMTRQIADLTFQDAASQVVVGARDGLRAVREALQVSAGLLASEQAGLAAWCLDTTVAYLKERRQFGRAVGSFQALKHRLADLYVQVQSARTIARYAAVTAVAGGEEAALAACLAKAYCSDVAVRAAEECVQLHGGIGMTWEHPAHLYLKRAKADQIALGTPARHRMHLSELVNLPAGLGDALSQLHHIAGATAMLTSERP